MRWPLRYQILFPFGGVMLAVVLGVGLLDAVLAARRTQRQIEHQLNEVAQTLLDATFPLTDAVFKQTRGLSGAEFLLTDRQGNLRATSLAPIDVSRIPREANAGREFRLGDPIELAAGRCCVTPPAIAPRPPTRWESIEPRCERSSTVLRPSRERRSQSSTSTVSACS